MVKSGAEKNAKTSFKVKEKILDPALALLFASSVSLQASQQCRIFLTAVCP